MAGETISLAFTQPDASKGELESDTPLYPGYELIHVIDARGNGAYQVRRVVQAVTVRDAARGIEPQYAVYPKKYQDIEDALAAAAAHYSSDGPGEVAKN